MFIHEAVKEAIQKNGNIRRKVWRNIGIKLYIATPLTLSEKVNGRRWWGPVAEKLMADDWEVVE